MARGFFGRCINVRQVVVVVVVVVVDFVPKVSNEKNLALSFGSFLSVKNLFPMTEAEIGFGPVKKCFGRKCRWSVSPG